MVDFLEILKGDKPGHPFRGNQYTKGKIYGEYFPEEMGKRAARDKLPPDSLSEAVMEFRSLHPYGARGYVTTPFRKDQFGSEVTNAYYQTSTGLVKRIDNFPASKVFAPDHNIKPSVPYVNPKAGLSPLSKLKPKV